MRKFASIALLASFVSVMVALPALALDRRVNIVNKTGYTMMEFYASNVDAKTWEEDILGKHVLESGQSVLINIDDGTGYCLYDFRAVFSDGDEVTKARVNVCEIGTFTFNP